jgi:hypothetical protein
VNDDYRIRIPEYYTNNNNTILLLLIIILLLPRNKINYNTTNKSVYACPLISLLHLLPHVSSHCPKKSLPVDRNATLGSFTYIHTHAHILLYARIYATRELKIWHP